MLCLAKKLFPNGKFYTEHISSLPFFDRIFFFETRTCCFSFAKKSIHVVTFSGFTVHTQSLGGEYRGLTLALQDRVRELTTSEEAAASLKVPDFGYCHLQSHNVPAQHAVHDRVMYENIRVFDFGGEVGAEDGEWDLGHH